MPIEGTELSSHGFMPHGMCYLWQPDILGLHIASDALIALAYFSIPFTLLHFVKKRVDLDFSWIITCFAAFIVACGSTHLMDIWVIWHPDYWISGAIKAVTAVVSVFTAILLAKLVPVALRWPRPESLAAAYTELQGEVLERRRVEKALQMAIEELRSEKARERLAAIIESTDDAIITKTGDGIITGWNPAAQDIFGYTAHQAIGQPATMLFPPERMLEEVGILERIGRGVKVEHFETQRLRKDGSTLDVSVTISPIKDERGSIIGASMIARDISARKRMDESLHDLAEALDLVPVIVRDQEGRIQLWTKGCERLFGFTRDEAVGRVFHEMLRTQFPEPLEVIDATLRRRGLWEGELTHRRKDDSEIAVASVWEMKRDSQGRRDRIVEYSTDVSARKEAERGVAAQLGRLALLNGITRAIGDRQDLPSIYQVVVRTLQEQLPIDFASMCMLDPARRTLTVACASDPERAARLGIAAQSVIDIDTCGLARCASGLLIYEPDTSAVPFALPSRLAENDLSAMVAAPLQTESDVFGVLIAARRVAHSFTPADCEFLKQISEHVALAAHQAQLYAELHTAYEEVRLTQQTVIQQERLRVVGQMASGIAHDINNALTPASLYSQLLLEERFGFSGEARELLVAIGRAVNDVAASVTRIRSFHHAAEPHSGHNPIELNRIIEQVIELTRARWQTMPQERGVVVRMKADLQPILPRVLGAEGEIRDALMNVVINAVDAMPQGGQITLRSRTLETGQVRIEAADTGVGMDETTRSRCIEPFFTTKGERGSGLGLAMVHGMAVRHGANVQIDSEPGRGTCVQLTFPALIDAAPVAPPLAAALPEPLRCLRILLIDDDPMLLRSLREVLRRDGHAIVVAEGGQSGLKAFRDALTNGEPFDAVITDLGMPHVDGRTVAIAVKSAAQNVRVIMLTGWGQRLIAEREVPPGVDRVLGKPPTIEALRATLAEFFGNGP